MWLFRCANCDLAVNEIFAPAKALVNGKEVELCFRCHHRWCRIMDQKQYVHEAVGKLVVSSTAKEAASHHPIPQSIHSVDRYFRDNKKAHNEPEDLRNAQRKYFGPSI